MTPDFTEQVLENCRNRAEDTAAAVQRALDPQSAQAKFSATVVEDASADSLTDDSSLAGAGLLSYLDMGDVVAAFAIPESSGLLPDWYGDPDPQQKKRLEALCQELAKIYFPEELIAMSLQAKRSPNLQLALQEGGATAETSKVLFDLTSGDAGGRLAVAYSLPHPEKLFSLPDDRPPAKKVEEDEFSWKMPPYDSVEEGLKHLPRYSRSLLKVKLPLRVVLANQRQPVSNITVLSHGALIQFEKPCDEMLALEIGNVRIAEGEAVKVGDKFGLRITSIVLPLERFVNMSTSNWR